MPIISLVNLYVDNPAASAAFYAGVLQVEAAQASPSFVLFKLPEGAGLGLWSRHDVEPAATAAGGGGELVFAVADLDGLYTDWCARGLSILMAPIDAPFGRTFVALDPDGHRLRAFTPA